MVEYCKYCGKTRTGPICEYCGHRYEKKRIEDVRHEMRRHLKKTKLRVPPLYAVVIFAVITALIIVLVILLLSPQIMNKTTLNANVVKNTQTKTAQTNTNTAVESTVSETPAPKLRVYHTMVNQLGGGMGCFGRVDGGVTNSGDLDALNVVVTCTAVEYSVQKDIGTVKVGQTQTFQAIINYDCSYMREEECTATCDNC